MKLFVAVSCLLVAASATPLFGTEQCAGGPGVWCVNIRTASQCGAVKHCQQNVWNRPALQSVPCDLCKELITIVGNFLKDNVTQSELLTYLNKGCEFLPEAPWVSQCKELVNEYFPLIFNMIESELSNPSVPCCAIGLCESLQQHLGSLKHPQQLLTNEIPEADPSKLVYPFMANLPLLYPLQNTPEEPKGDVCQDCLQFITDVQDSLKSNSSFSKMLVENALKQCDQLGGGLSEMCKTYVNQYCDLFLQMMIQMNQPAKDICCDLGVCSQKKLIPLQEIVPAKTLVPAMKLQPAVKIGEKPPVTVDPVCEVCQLAMKELERILEKNATRMQIEEALEKLCYLLPSTYRDQCKDLIEQYSEAIIMLLEQEISPKMICSAIGLCSTRQLKTVALNPEHVKSGHYCPVCKLIVNYLDEILQENSTETEILKALQVVCNYLPPDYYDECRVLILNYEPLLIQLLVQVMDPTLVCQKMNMCAEDLKPLLGVEKCMWGPSYWCRDLETAGLCSAIEHCKRHVWN